MKKNLMSNGLIYLVVALLFLHVFAAQALAIIAGEHHAYQITSTSKTTRTPGVTDYYGWLGTDGYISPPNPRVFDWETDPTKRDDHSNVCLASDFGERPDWNNKTKRQQIQTGFWKGSLAPQGDTDEVRVYYEVDDYFGKTLATSSGNHAGGSAKAFYTYYNHYNASNATYTYYAAINSLSGVIGYGYYKRKATASVAMGETWLKNAENLSVATQMGRSRLGSSDISYALHLKNGSGGWELWDNSLTANTTFVADERSNNGYYISHSNQYYNFLVYGPGN